jgi:cobalt-zinc-cadmium efflux system membrane fusion protein
MKKLLYIMALSLLLISCKKSKVEEETPKKNGFTTVTEAQFKSLAMEIATPVEQDFDLTIKTSGKIDVPPQNRAKVTTFVGGYVKATTLLVGDKVKKGQALLKLQSTEFLDIQKEYVEVMAQLTFLKSEYDRQKTLFDENITSQKNYLKAESDFRSAKAMSQSLRAKLLLLNINPKNVENGKLTSIITIFAPISGDIVIMNAEVGMYAAPSDVILEIVDTDHLHLELAVFEKNILNIKLGQKIVFTVPEASKETFNAEVYLVGKSLEGNGRTVNVHAHLEEEMKQKLLTGMFVEANVIIDSKKGLAVPSEAVTKEDNKSFVLLLANKNNGYSFKKVLVQTGEKSDKFVEIFPNKTINASSKILIKGVFEVTN